jgi:hypothetical protein
MYKTYTQAVTLCLNLSMVRARYLVQDLMPNMLGEENVFRHLLTDKPEL